MPEKKLDFETFQTVEIFQKLDTDMMAKLAPMLEEKEYAEGETIFEEEDRAEYLYIVVKGTVLLNMSASEDLCVTVMSAETGECFGWTALLGGFYYTASAVAAEATRLWVVNAWELNALLQKEPKMGFRIMEYVARDINNRLKKRTKQLFQALIEHIDMVCGLREID